MDRLAALALLDAAAMASLEAGFDADEACRRLKSTFFASERVCGDARTSLQIKH